MGQVDPRADDSGGGPVKRLTLPYAFRDDRVKGASVSPFGSISGLMWNTADWSIE